MKKLFSLFSMLVLLSSNALPTLTYANTESEDMAIDILSNLLESLSNETSSLNEELLINNENPRICENWYTVTFDLNWWEWYEDNSTDTKTKISNWNDIWPLLWRTPSKEWNACNWKKCMFDWWYLEREWNTRWTWYVTEDMTVYAKWLEFEDYTVTLGSKTFTIMDRNLWATSSSRSSAASRWYVFQWWNNYWFKIDTSSKRWLNWERTTDEQVEFTEDYVSNYYNWIRNTNTGSWFVYRSQDKNLWWWWSFDYADEMRQWPCPKWYHVPTQMEWDEADRANSWWKDLNIKLNLPNTYNYSTYNDSVSTDRCEYRWSTDWILVYWTDYGGWYVWKFSHITISSIWASTRYFSPSSTLSAIRCFADIETKNIILQKNWWYTTFDVNSTPRWWEYSKNLPNVNQRATSIARSNSIFWWWYTTEDFQEWTLVTNNNIETDRDEITIYAKRSCETWYTLSDDWQACVPNATILHSNTWVDNIEIWVSYNLENPFINDWYRFIWWNTQSDWMWENYWLWDIIINSWIDLYAQWIKNPRIYFYSNELLVNPWNASILKLKYRNNLEIAGVRKSHTSNISDEWLKVDNKNYDNNLAINDIITIPNAKKLEISLKYWTESNRDYLYVFDWEYSWTPSKNMTAWQLYTFNWSSNDPIETTFSIEWDTVTFSFFSDSSNSFYWYYAVITWINSEDEFFTEEEILIPTNPWHEFLWRYEENSEIPFDFEIKSITEDKNLYAKWKSLEEKAQETITGNVVYTNNTTVTVWDETKEEVLSWSSTLTLVSKEVEDKEVKKEEDTTKVQDSEIKVTSDKTVEYEWWLEVYLEKTDNVGTENETTWKVEWTIKFSAPVAVKIPISSDAEYVKVQVKHWDEDFGYKWLTLNPVNECNNWEAVSDKYDWEDVLVTWNTQKYATIYTCSASTFVAYTENKKPVEPTPSAWGGRTITTTKQENKVVDQEHNSADTEEVKTTNKTTDTTSTENIQQQVQKVSTKSLTRWEVAVMTNILLEVYPQLVEWKAELDDVTNACSNYADEQNFTKDEKKAITRLCKLSIMWIHNDTNEPLEEFLVNDKSTNDEFSKVINRSVANYNEKDLSTIKEALKKLEWDEENVVFGTVYDMFMGIKNIFS